ncbi:tetratricopeptide repeat protein [Flexithrix dorotheae]|uniref:tetratricopeptide repeat protein n=1 Tax=Flexithrix dorotheae TaxID=70993 RepID=UPI00037358BE|nr:tetratricopeptide repeat protein [Flexithrix dorotheae]
MIKAKLTLIFFIITFSSFAQNTLIVSDEDYYFRDGLELFDKEKYGAAKNRFEQYIALDRHDDKTLQSMYYRGVCALKLETDDFQHVITEFVHTYPTHPKARKAAIYLGNYYFDQARYDVARDYYLQSPASDLETADDMEATFKLGYSYFALGDYPNAKSQFDKLNVSNNQYAMAASYYSGYLDYENGDYSEAITKLEKAKLDNRYNDEATILIAGIYYKQNRYAEVLQITQSMGNDLPPGLDLLTGECYYKMGDYQTASKYFDNFLADSTSPGDRGVNYRIGYADFQTNKPAEAIPFFSKAADGQDTLAQSAAYHLALCYINTDQKELAVTTLDQCRRLDYDPRIKELGALTYVKVNYDIGYYTEALEGGEYYLNTFPQGKYAQEVYEIASDAFLNTGDYEKAMGYLSRIQNKTRKIQQAYQEISFNKAVSDFNDEKFQDAANALNTSLQFAINPNLAGSANFWLGESYSAIAKYDSAIMYYPRVQPSAKEYHQAIYGMAYAFYNNKDYSAAERYFAQYVQTAPNAEPGKKTDAILRLADCYYIAKNYGEALKFYDAAQDNQSPEIEYIYFQKAFVYKALNRLNDAVASFDNILNNFPNSTYRDQALFQKAEIYFENGRRQEAFDYYGQLLTEFPEGQIIPYALAKQAVAAKMIGKMDVAAINHKKIIDAYIANKSLAETAIQSLQEINAGGYPIYDLQDYIAKFSAVYSGSEVVLQSKFETAQLPFNNEDYANAVLSLKDFIDNSPTTAYTYEAYYKIGFSYEMLNDKENAIQAYLNVEGVYKVRSLRNGADLQYDLQNYSAAVETYSELLQVAKKKKYIEDGTVGLMKSYYGLKDYDATLLYAQQIVEENYAREINTAELYKGKVMFSKKQYAEAIAQFQKTIGLAQDKNAAEAQYMIGATYRDQGQFETSTQELIKVRSNYENYADWVYEAFLLIAENYISLDNSFQAKATLNSIIEYSKDEEIKARAQKRLNEIEA